MRIKNTQKSTRTANTHKGTHKHTKNTNKQTQIIAKKSQNNRINKQKKTHITAN